MIIRFHNEEFENELKAIIAGQDIKITVAEAIEYYVNNVDERVWIAMWKRYKTKSHIQMRESAELMKIQFTEHIYTKIFALA